MVSASEVPAVKFKTLRAAWFLLAIIGAAAKSARVTSSCRNRSVHPLQSGSTSLSSIIKCAPVAA
jgi:hypothetical protein